MAKSLRNIEQLKFDSNGYLLVEAAAISGTLKSVSSLEKLKVSTNKSLLVTESTGGGTQRRTLRSISRLRKDSNGSLLIKIVPAGTQEKSLSNIEQLKFDENGALYVSVVAGDATRVSLRNVSRLRTDEYGNLLVFSDSPLGATPIQIFIASVIADGGTVESETLIQQELDAIPTLLKPNCTFMLAPACYAPGTIYGMNPQTGAMYKGTFSASTARWVVNKNGKLVKVGANIPRFSWDADTLEYLGLVVERNSTPVSINPDSDGTGMTAGNVTFAVNNWADTVFLNKAVFGDNSVQRSLFNNFSVSSSTTYNITAFVKMSDNSIPVIGITNTTGDFSFIIGGKIAPTVYAPRHVGNGVYRIGARILSAELGTPTSAGQNGIVKHIGQSAKGFEVTGIVIETNNTPSTYSADGNTILTRARELPVFADISGFYNNSAPATWYSEFYQPAHSGTGTIIKMTPVSNSYYRMRFNVSSGYGPQNSNAGSADVSNYAGSISPVGNKVKFMAAFASGDVAASSNGTIVTDTTNLIPQPFTAISIGTAIDAASESMNGPLKRLYYAPVRRTNAEMQAITTL